MAKRVAYPDWVERYRGDGITIRKVRNGYGLYRCTSVYVKGSHPKSVQEYLGMVTEEDGFIPKKVISLNPAFVEHGLSRFIMANFKRDLQRSTFNGSADGDVITLGIIRFIFGAVEPCFIRATYISHGIEGRLLQRMESVNPMRTKTIANKIEQLLTKRIPDESERRIVRGLLLLCVIDPANPSVKPHIPTEAVEIIERRGLKYE